MKLLLALAVGVAVAFPSTAPGQPQWLEQGDAGDLCTTAQTPVGTGPLQDITGSLGAGNDVDLYFIQIVNRGIFRATTCGSAQFDTQLWLFNEACNGVTHNDDSVTLCPTTLQSEITGQFVPANGCYTIAISHYNRDAATGEGAFIWLNGPFRSERPPDGPGAPGPLRQWLGGTPGGVTYAIRLEGVSYCGATAVEPTTWGQIKARYQD